MKVEKDYLDTLFEFYGIESAPNQKDGIWIKGENGELEPFDCLKNFQDIFFPTAQNQEETFSFKDLNTTPFWCNWLMIASKSSKLRANLSRLCTITVSPKRT